MMPKTLDVIKVVGEIHNELSKRDCKLFNLAISGSHLYGFESEDSDVDYRGTFVVNTNQLLGIRKPLDVIELKIGENDIVLFELKKEIGLALNSNCNVLEHINANQIFNLAAFVEFRQIINNSFGKRGLYDSYHGLAEFNYKKFILQGRNTVKKYLYVFRALMAGIHILQTGRIEANVEKLNAYFKLQSIKTLIKHKQMGKEFMELPIELQNGTLEKDIDMLFERMDKAYEKCKIPDRPSEEDFDKVNKFTIGIRKDNMR